MNFLLQFLSRVQEIQSWTSKKSVARLAANFRSNNLTIPKAPIQVTCDTANQRLDKHINNSQTCVTCIVSKFICERKH